jgi:hypothetical protein
VLFLISVAARIFGPHAVYGQQLHMSVKLSSSFLDFFRTQKKMRKMRKMRKRRRKKIQRKMRRLFQRSMMQKLGKPKQTG